MGKPIAYKTGSIQPPNTAKQSNVIVGVGPSNWGAGAANATFYNGLDSTYQYVIITGSNPPAFWGTGDFTTSSLLTTLNGLPDRVGQTRFTDANVALSSSLATGKYTILKNEQVYGAPITNGLVFSVNGPSTEKNLFNASTYPTSTGWFDYGGYSFYDITNDPPYTGSKSTIALRGFGTGCYSGGALEVGKTYTFSFWIKVLSPAPSDGFITWNNQFGSGETNSWQLTLDSSSGVFSTNWQKITQTFTLNAVRTQFYFLVYSPSTPSFRSATGPVLCTELQLEEGSTATKYALPSFSTPINEGLLNTSSLSLANGAYFNTSQSGIFNFDGVDDYAVLTDASLKNYTTITANMWMYVTSSNAWETYFSYNAEEAGLSQGWGVRRQSTNNIFQYWGGTGNTGIKLYQNGQLLDSSNSTYSQANATINNTWQMVTLVAKGVSTWNTHNRLSIATRSDGLNTATNMKMGSFNIYNRELSAAEIQNLYTAGLPTYQSSSNLMVNQGLTLYLDATNPNSYTSGSSTWNDLSGYGNNGTLYNGVAYSSTYGGGLVFDGVDDYVVVPGNGTVNATKPTVELVTTVSTNGGNVIAQGQYGSNWGFGVGVKPSAIMARNNNGDANYSVSNSGLVHIVVVWDGSGNQYYKNGQYLGRTTTNYSPNPGGDVTIGGVRSQYPSSNLQEFANSTVNIVRIYNRALSPTEILQNFNSIKTQFGL
jgi:hypothetical protein